MTLDYVNIQRTISPLRLIFWGGLFCILDLNYSFIENGEGWKFDLLDDAVGVMMIMYGLARLREVEVDERYAKALTFVSVVAVFALLVAIHNHRIYHVPPALTFCFSVIGVFKLVAMLVFCGAMRRLCEHAQLVLAARSWSTTITLFTVIYLIPLGIYYCAVGITTLTGSNFNYHIDRTNLAGAEILFLTLLLLFFIPFIHFFISTSRMIHEAIELPPDNSTDSLYM